MRGLRPHETTLNSAREYIYGTFQDQKYTDTDLQQGVLITEELGAINGLTESWSPNNIELQIAALFSKNGLPDEDNFEHIRKSCAGLAPLACGLDRTKIAQIAFMVQNFDKIWEAPEILEGEVGLQEIAAEIRQKKTETEKTFFGKDLQPEVLQDALTFDCLPEEVKLLITAQKLFTIKKFSTLISSKDMPPSLPVATFPQVIEKTKCILLPKTFNPNTDRHKSQIETTGLGTDQQPESSPLLLAKNDLSKATKTAEAEIRAWRILQAGRLHNTAHHKQK